MRTVVRKQKDLMDYNKEYPPKCYEGMGIFTPGEMRNKEYLKLNYSSSTPDSLAAISF